MKKFYELYNYFQWVEIKDDVIVDYNCTCMDFTLKKLNLEKNGKIRTKGMCKHLKRINDIHLCKKVVIPDENTRIITKRESCVEEDG